MTKENSSLHRAKKEKNDEFYTQLKDVENECFQYKEQFKGKTIFLNCDDPEESMFWKYFELNFDFFGLKKLISTHFEEDKPSYKLEITGDIDGDGKVTNKDIIKTPLKENGDFRSNESIEILKECDIVVSNPPFSLFREYIIQLMEHDKKFLIMGNNNAVTYKDVFKYIKENRLWLGYNSNKTMEFAVPDSYEFRNGNGFINSEGVRIIKVPAITWFTNLPHTKRNEKLILYKEYNEIDYPKYDNFNVINIDKVKEIPKDYYGCMGVPITFLGKHNPEQFEILGAECFQDIETSENVFQKPTHKLENSNREVYKRIWIKRR